MSFPFLRSILHSFLARLLEFFGLPAFSHKLLALWACFESFSALIDGFFFLAVVINATTGLRRALIFAASRDYFFIFGLILLPSF